MNPDTLTPDEARDAELTQLREAVRVLAEAVKPLADACLAEFEGADTAACADDEAVAAGDGCESPITFGMIRKAKAALDAARENASVQSRD
jgi:hypothetical protein